MTPIELASMAMARLSANINLAGPAVPITHRTKYRLQ